MSEETQSDGAEEILDLDIPLEGVDTDYPSLSVGKHPVEIVGQAIKPGKKNPTDKYWTLTLKTLADTENTKGAPLPAGFQTFYRLGLQEREGFDFRRPLAKLVEAAFGQKLNFNKDTRDAIVGKHIVVVVKKSKDPEYGETEIKDVEALQGEVAAEVAGSAGAF